MDDDMTLLREFSASRSDAAFAALVQRHIGLVHRRRCGRRAMRIWPGTSRKPC